MTGDEADFQSRIRLTLPEHWFGDTPPVLNGLLAGLSSVWTGLHALLQVVRLQSRLQTATDGFLDLASADFFARRFARRPGEPDESFRPRLLRTLRRLRATRAGLVSAAQEAGYTIQVFEPARPTDTGAYSVAGAWAWGVAGGWGSLEMPLECLVTARGGPGTDDAQLRQELAAALPAGGVAWLRIVN